DAQQAEGLDVSKAHSGGGVAGPRPATPKGDALNNDPADHATPDVLPK
ncbi:MAG: hypothetical protein H7Z42_05850, partial [Roseiflexaceae bacterium]|nr:hypothetical protein [Roseiflexaceae bacterium]